MSLRRIYIIVGLTLAGLAASGMGYRLIEPLDTLSTLALVPFAFLVFDIRKAVGERRFRTVFAWFAICLLPNYHSASVVEAAPQEWRAVVGFIGVGVILYLIRHFSLYGDWSDPNMREKIFVTNRPSVIQSWPAEGQTMALPDPEGIKKSSPGSVCGPGVRRLHQADPGGGRRS